MVVLGCSEKPTLRRKSGGLTVQVGIALDDPIHIHLALVNGKSGKPMGKQNLNVSWDDNFSEIAVFIPKSGSADTAVPSGVSRVHIMVGPRIGNEPYRIAFLNCNKPRSPAQSKTC